MATITGTIERGNAAYASGSVVFRLKDPPLNQSPVLLIGGDVVKATTNSSGAFSIVLRAGKYVVLIQDCRLFEIEVPDNSNTYNILSLIVASVPYVGTVPPGTAVDLGFRAWNALATMKLEASAVGLKAGWLFGLASAGDQEPRAYRFVFGDSSVADDIWVIAPTDNLGRWIRFA